MFIANVSSATICPLLRSHNEMIGRLIYHKDKKPREGPDPKYNAHKDRVIVSQHRSGQGEKGGGGLEDYNKELT